MTREGLATADETHPRRAAADRLTDRARPGVPETGAAARRWQSGTLAPAQRTAHKRDLHTGAGPSDRTALTAIHPQPCQPGPAPLHARRNDSGDTGPLRAGDPARRRTARQTAHGQWLMGKPDASQRRER